MFEILFLTAVLTSFRVCESSNLINWFRPPAVPLIVVDPYLSLWSTYDNLYDGKTTHWNGNIIELTGLLVVNGNCYRWMGSDDYDQCSNTVKQVNYNFVSVSFL